MNFFVLILSIILAAIIIVFFFRTRRRPAREELNVSPPLPARSPDAEFAAEIGPSVSVPPAPAGQTAPELPRRYGEDRLVLLARDPHWLFAYWEVSATKQEEFQARYGPEAWRTSRPVLRLYDVTGIKFEGYNANSYVDIPISEEADNWYLEVGQPNRTFCVDLGRLLPTGEFVTLLRSNLAHTPRAALSELCDEEWMWLEGVYRSMLRYQFGISSPLLFEEIAARMGKEVIPVGIGSPVILPPMRR
ncbi:DUF4912 domain-containing protein [Thermodesulfitimonas autotrophica]|uniref:DUF4912 domain-containing protein n=1 Tax=Thermodesulfitimonas autotrophica TaxID=1894989 RepID=UPI002FE05CCF